MSQCIIWGKGVNRKGYGTVSHHGEKRLAHRVAYAEHRGLPLEAIDGQVVRHTCDNPPCVNPEHLLLGSVQDNNRDIVDRERQCRGESRPDARLTEDDVQVIRDTYVRGSSTLGQYALASRYGVSQSMISYIITGKNWRHV